MAKVECQRQGARYPSNVARRSPTLPQARVRQCADGARPEIRRVFGALRRCNGPVGILVLALLCTMLLYVVSAWLMLESASMRTMAGS